MKRVVTRVKSFMNVRFYNPLKVDDEDASFFVISHAVVASPYVPRR